MIGKGLLVLEDCMNLLELGPESCAKSEVMKSCLGYTDWGGHGQKRRRGSVWM